MHPPIDFLAYSCFVDNHGKNPSYLGGNVPLDGSWFMGVTLVLPAWNGLAKHPKGIEGMSFCFCCCFCFRSLWARDISIGYRPYYPTFWQWLNWRIRTDKYIFESYPPAIGLPFSARNVPTLKPIMEQENSCSVPWKMGESRPFDEFCKALFASFLFHSEDAYKERER